MATTSPPSPVAQTAPPNPANDTASKIKAALGAGLAPDSQKKSTADKYGLGAWGQATINTQGLFDQPSMTTDDAMQKFLQYAQDSSKVGIVAAIQQALYMSGNYYSTSYQYVPGVVRPEDQTAFAKFLQQNAQMQDGTDPSLQKPLATVLQDNAQRGLAFGVNAAKPAAQKVYQLPAEADLEASAMNAAENVLGRKATKSEAAAFAAYYRHIVTNYDSTMDGTKAQAKADAQAARNGLYQSGPDTVGGQGVSGSTAQNNNTYDGTAAPPSMLQHELGDGSAAGTAASGPNAVPDAQPTDPGAFLQHIGDLANVASQQNTAAQTPGSPLQVEQPASTDVAAQDYFRNNNPGEAGANDMSNTFGQFLKIISGKLV